LCGITLEHLLHERHAKPSTTRTGRRFVPQDRSNLRNRGQVIFRQMSEFGMFGLSPPPPAAGRLSTRYDLSRMFTPAIFFEMPNSRAVV
jgi:hypothetical protein